jgi:hypothetical protein
VGLFPWLPHHDQVWCLCSLLCRESVVTRASSLPLKTVCCEWLFFHYFCLSLVSYFSRINFCYIILIWTLTYFVTPPPPPRIWLVFKHHLSS